MTFVRWIFVVLVAAVAAIGGTFLDFASDDPGLRVAAGTFDGRFLAVSDADMAGTAYADGKLEPLPGGRDEVALFAQGRVVAAAPASNSVVSWPQILDVSPDGRFAFVVETRAPPPDGVTAYKDATAELPVGTRLSIFAVEPQGLRLVDMREGLGRNLKSVEYARGGFLVIGSETAGAELVIVKPAADGMIGDVRRLALPAVFLGDDVQKSISAVHISPDGLTLAANIANHRVQFYRLSLDAHGVPRDVAALGAASAHLGRRLATGKWTPDGRFFVVTDTNGGGAGAEMLVQGPGALTVLRPPQEAGDAPEVVSRVEAGRFPEGFAISADGTRVAAINLERTYLPELWFLDAWAGRRHYSLTLMSLDPQTGALKELDRLHQAGIMPEDVIFDAGGRNLAVAVFHRRQGNDRRRGFIDFFSVEGGAKLVSQGVTQPVMRGSHDLVRIP